MYAEMAPAACGLNFERRTRKTERSEDLCRDQHVRQRNRGTGRGGFKARFARDSPPDTSGGAYTLVRQRFGPTTVAPFAI